MWMGRGSLGSYRKFFESKNETFPFAHPALIDEFNRLFSMGFPKMYFDKGLIIFVCSYHPITFRHQVQALYFLRPMMLFNLDVRQFS